MTEANCELKEASSDEAPAAMELATEAALELVASEEATELALLTIEETPPPREDWIELMADDASPRIEEMAEGI